MRLHERIHLLLSGYRVSHSGSGTCPHPAAPDYLRGARLQPAGPAQSHPAGGVVPQPICRTRLHQLQQGKGAGRPAGQCAEQLQGTAGQNEEFPRQRHGLSGQQHAAQLAGRPLLPPDSS